MVQFIHYFDPVKTYVVIQVPKAEIYSTIRHLGTVLLISFIVAILLIIGAIYMIGRQISDQLNKSVVFAKQIADGDMNANIQINTKDEIGQLSSALKEMTARLKEIISVISSGTENIASASEELSSSAESLSGSANEQASSLEEISSSIDQLVQNIRKSADNSKGINSITGNIVSDMQMVGNASTKSMDAISKISQKITIINDIAFQTNLLALNAAVEAARAGEHGRGFAVVAAEVRKLAERSKQAAEEINQLAGETISLTSQTESLIQKVIPEIKQASLMIDEITTANIEESDGTTQINTGVQQLNRTTQHNASSSEQLAGSAEELANQASQLKESMSYFKV